jgi:hypothetical protein
MEYVLDNNIPYDQFPSPCGVNIVANNNNQFAYAVFYLRFRPLAG